LGDAGAKSWTAILPDVQTPRATIPGTMDLTSDSIFDAGPPGGGSGSRHGT